jgi:hypothetical protein
MIFACYIRPSSYKNCLLFIKMREKFFSIVLENFCVFFGIYNKFVKFLKDLANVSITLKILIPEN